MGYEKEKNNSNQNSSQVICSRIVKCPFMLIFVSSGIGQNITVRCGIHNHELAKDVVGHDI